MNKLKILALIPARSGSKGLQNKNIKLLNNKPLIFYSINAARKSKIFDEICVSTDSEEYQKIAIDCGASVPFLRSKENSHDKSSSVDMVIEVLDSYKKMNKNFDILVLLQPTSPLRDAKDIQYAFFQFLAFNVFQNIHEKYSDFAAFTDSIFNILGIKNENISEEKKLLKAIKIMQNKFVQCKAKKLSLLSINDAKKHPNLMRTANCNNHLQKLNGFNSATSTRQEYSQIYEINGAIYINFVDDITKQTSFNNNELGYKMDAQKSIDIDNEIDFLMAQFLMKYQNRAKRFKKTIKDNQIDSML